MALSSPRRLKTMVTRGPLNLGIVLGVTCFQGGLAMLSSGFVRPARAGQGGNDLAKIADVASSRVIGFFDATKTGGAANGSVTVDVCEAIGCLKNSAGADEVTAAHVGRPCYAVDDETVALTSAGGTRPRAGIVHEVSDEGVWVDVSTASAAGAPRSVFLPWSINETDTLAGTSAELVAPAAGNIVRNSVIVQKAVTTGGDVTASVGGVAVDGLACTIANAAAKGTVVTDVPTLGHASTAVAAGDRIQIVPAAGFDTAGAVSGVLEIALK
jgi:hypothetical protein